ncbi:ATP-binding protein, partial [bacterium]|nr:ATP-binding protein [bacterium]
CSCQITRLKKILLQSSRIPKRYDNCEFENFDVPLMTSKKKSCGKDWDTRLALKTAKDVAMKFVEKYPVVDNNRGILFMGNPGVGKTHLAVSIIKALIQKKTVPCIFYDFRELLQDIKNSFGKSSEVSQQDILNPILNLDVVVLDDLGAEKTTGWVLDNLGYIINSRYNNSRFTIITTNYLDEDRMNPKGSLYQWDKSQESLTDRIGMRLRSRLYEMCYRVILNCEDFRKAHIARAFD